MPFVGESEYGAMVESTALSRGILLVAGVALLGIAVRTYRTQRKPVGRWFSALLGLLGVTALCIGVTEATGTLNKLIWLVTNLSIPLVLLAFAFNYYGITLFTSRTRTVAVFTPAILGLIGSTVLILGTPAMSPGPVAPLAAVPDIAVAVATTLDQVGYYYTAFVVIIAVGLVAQNVVRYDHLDTRLAASIAFVGAWPWLGNFVVPQLGTTFGDAVSLGVLAVGYGTSAVVAGLVVGPLELFASSPAAGNVGPDRVLDSMDDAVIITDDRGSILRLNRVACAVFDADETVAVGRSLSDVIGVSVGDIDEAEPTELRTTDGIRQFAVTRSPVTDGNEYDRGTVLVLRDITQRQTREQRLAVLNRVLRHNLRNNASSIIGRAQLIESGQKKEDAAEKIIETTQTLVGVAESARDIENMMAATQTDETTSLTDTVEYVVNTVETEYPNVEFTTALPADATAAVSGRALETVLTHLVENAAEHNDAEEPIVVVSGDNEGETLQIAVSDNGPGIPEHEQSVLDARQEDQLHHGSGLGLWAVHWGITQMGGTLSISENDPRGSIVTVSIPAAEPTPAVADEREEANEYTVA